MQSDIPTQSVAHSSVQVVEESSTSALFSLAMVIVYDECIISQVLTVQTLLTCLVLSLTHSGGGMMDCYVAVHNLSLCTSLSSLLLAPCPHSYACVSSARECFGHSVSTAARSLCDHVFSIAGDAKSSV